MGLLISIFKHKRYVIFLNFSFLLVACVFLIIQFNSLEILDLRISELSNDRGDQQDCKNLQSVGDYKAKCRYLKSHGPCVTEGYIDYLHLFYCNFGSVPFLGHFLLFLWLLVLFYLLGNTASEYFCSSLENLSGLLRLSPIIAGVTLLSLGNGAPDVFASLVSFMGSGTCDVGFNTVLGGASFITCVVVGVISILVKQKEIRVNKNAFVRDVCFFLIVLATLGFILLHGQISLWNAIGFLSMYIFYVIIVYCSDMLWSNNGGKISKTDANLSYGSDLSIPILCSMEKGEVNCSEEGGLESVDAGVEMKQSCFCLQLSSPYHMLLVILEMPLYLPRRLTIPVVCEEKWSKPTAVASVTLAPVLLSVLWNPHDENSSFKNSMVVYGIGFLFGVTFGVLAYATTEKASPPKKCLLPWLAGGFLMSVVWSYLIAQELVALLVSMGSIFQVSPSILGLTVLAWGNSLGDLITNLTMALNSGPEGAQVAISGCYAGPIFNILFGLGLSLVGSAWYQYPSPVVITRDPYLLETLTFLVASLLWALMILPSRKMRLDGVLGGGLLVIYLVSMSTRIIQTLGSLQF
ncbi:cation/calcium exchanger 2 [Ricinus communis]|uniref:Sodium/potassium/calcium exchanger 6, putative n=1 Tax=Ricinus communis TaxID=3988 RepID=B9SI62_RICCO|nr:cation/calcium exchanger 2 [Ricinus communis]EEF36664.1 Sodium/potassium/calcium exchanger 6 precursor, putative [Ricinus communis]|eukprot:XP_002525681.1 cation/calcium exchanger 2 [Ricinus communis]